MAAGPGGFRERRKMIHNVLARQLPVRRGARDRGPRGGRHRPGPAARRPLAVGEWLALREALGPIGPDRRGRREGRARDRRSTRRAASTPVVRLAPAKLNLTLAVVGRRPDGFHDLHSVFVPLALADRLSLAPGRRPTPTRST